MEDQNIFSIGAVNNDVFTGRFPPTRIFRPTLPPFDILRKSNLSP